MSIFSKLFGKKEEDSPKSAEDFMWYESIFSRYWL